jgi:hypothetical protein
MNRSRLAFAMFGARYEFNPTFGPVILYVMHQRLVDTVIDPHDILSTHWNSSATGPLFDAGPVPPQLTDVLPADYLNAVRKFGGREGFLGNQYLRLHRLDELAALNAAYDVPNLIPEVIIFGSDGGGEAFAFTFHEQTVIQIPFIPLSPENVLVKSSSFTGFIQFLHGTGESLEKDRSRIGMQLHAIQPIALGGDPVAPNNRALLPPRKHAELAQYWNQVYNHARLRSQKDA